MHNRVRMVVASFLVKDLLIPWQEGAAWFWDTLVDADLANNTLGWQWTAGSGPDAAPYFRIFSPVSQGEKFDPNGDYVRRWIPELAKLPNAWVHKPWEAHPRVLADAEIELGRTYPRPIVDHQEAALPPGRAASALGPPPDLDVAAAGGRKPSAGTWSLFMTVEISSTCATCSEWTGRGLPASPAESRCSQKAAFHRELLFLLRRRGVLRCS